jgi:hypothetical protein
VWESLVYGDMVNTFSLGEIEGKRERKEENGGGCFNTTWVNPELRDHQAFISVFSFI